MRLATPADLATMNAKFAELGSNLGKQIGDKLAAHLERLKASQEPAKPFTFVGGVELATYSASEATAFVDNLDVIGVGEYANAAQEMAAAGISFGDYARSKLADRYGVGMTKHSGYEAMAGADLLTAIDRQSEKFAEKFPVRRLNLTNPLLA